jgi:hypothetical protein
MSDVDLQLYDIVMVPKNAGQRVSEQGIRSLVNYLHATGLAKASGEVCSAHWTEIYFETYVGSHDIFYEGEIREGPPVFLELCLRFGAEPVDPGYADVSPVFFYAEFRGTPFDRILDELPARAHDILYIGPQTFVREHQGLPDRPDQEGEAVDKRRKPTERGEKLAGTRVEEI